MLNVENYGEKSINGRKWYADGTFFPITGLDHCAQIYIISIKNEHENCRQTHAQNSKHQRTGKRKQKRKFSFKLMARLSTA